VDEDESRCVHLKPFPHKYREATKTMSDGPYSVEIRRLVLAVFDARNHEREARANKKKLVKELVRTLDLAEQADRDSSKNNPESS
jgi:hypothetical protein